MPTEDENIQFLYLMVTHGGQPTLDMTAIAAALKLNNGAASKRWSRLRKAIEAGIHPGPSAYELLWLAVKHSPRDRVLNWKEIAARCNTTPGAASKRYSRMRKAFETGAPAPGSTGGSPSKAQAAAGATLPTTPKRKRAKAGSAKKKTPLAEEMKYKYDPDDGEGSEEEFTPTKKTKREGANAARTREKAPSKVNTKGRKPPVKQELMPDTSASPSPGLSTIHPSYSDLPTSSYIESVNPTEATTFIKAEPDDTGEDTSEEQYYDVAEYFIDGEDAVAKERKPCRTMHDSECQQVCECQAARLEQALSNIPGSGLHDWLDQTDTNEYI